MRYAARRHGKNCSVKKDIKLEDYVVFSIGMMILYTVVELVLSSLTQITHDTLTTCFFAFFGGEITICGLIKIFKLKEKGDTLDEEFEKVDL